MKTRFTFLILILLLTATAAGAQDIIFKRTGKEIQAIVVDISPGVVKYKKFDNKNGPVFSIAREQVEKIIYENGKTIDFTKPERDIEEHEQENILPPEKTSPTLGWHLGIGASNLYGDIEGSKMQTASAIGVSFTLPVGRKNTLLFEADILSLGCTFEDMDYIDHRDSSRVVITNASEDLGYIGLVVMDRYFLNEKRNYFLEGGIYGSFLMDATMLGDAEITDTTGMIISGSFEDKLLDFYSSFDFGLAGGIGGRIPIDKNGKWHISAGARFYYGLVNITNIDIPGLDYKESNIYGLIFVGVDIPTRSKQ
ncbi:MAG: PorT family protein [Bacteroidetes bacterium]|nr:PorT family protein [Bacteroidota bacterium]